MEYIFQLDDLKMDRGFRNIVNSIDDCAKDGVQELLTTILCGIKEISQSNQSRFNMMQSIVVRNSCLPSLAQSSIDVSLSPDQKSQFRPNRSKGLTSNWSELIP